MLKESSTSAATDDMDAHGGNSAYEPELSVTIDYAWESFKKNWKLVKLALKYGDCQRVERSSSYIRFRMETRKFGK